MAKMGIGEIMRAVAQAKSRKEKIEILRSRDSKSLRLLLKYSFDPAITWLIPQGAPPYKECQDVDIEHMFQVQAPTMYLFVSGDRPNPLQATEADSPQKRAQKRMKMEQKFAYMLEGLTPLDAQTVIAAKDRKLKGIDARLVDEAFPGLLSALPETKKKSKKEPDDGKEPAQV